MRCFIPLLFLGLTAGIQFHVHGQTNGGNRNNQIQPSNSNQMVMKGPRLAKADDYAVGLRWGDLSGIDGKVWFSETQAIGMSLAFLNRDTAVSANYLYHFRGGIEDVTELKNTDPLVPYIGAGLIGVFGEDTEFFGRDTEDFGLGVRIPFGLEFLTNGPRIGLFAEIAPSFAVVPTTFPFASGEFGARFYF